MAEIKLVDNERAWYIPSEILQLPELNITDKLFLSRVRNLIEMDYQEVSIPIISNTIGVNKVYGSRVVKKLVDAGYLDRKGKSLSVGPNMPERQKKNSGVFVPEEIILLPDLAISQRVIFGYLKTFIDKNKTVFPGNSHLAKIFSLSEAYVSKTISLLVERGYLTRREHKFSMAGGFSTKRYLTLTDENREKINVDRVTEASANSSLKQKGAKRLKEAWERQYKNVVGVKWKDPDPKKNNAIWSQFVESLIKVLHNEQSDENSKAHSISQYLDTWEVRLIERLMYIYLNERDRIFFSKPQGRNSPSEFTSLYCISELTRKFYASYYSDKHGSSIKEHHYSIQQFYDRGEGMDPSKLPIAVIVPEIEDWHPDTPKLVKSE